MEVNPPLGTTAAKENTAAHDNASVAPQQDLQTCFHPNNQTSSVTHQSLSQNDRSHPSASPSQPTKRPASSQGRKNSKRQKKAASKADIAEIEQVKASARVGTLVWASQGDPWWPAMVTYDPNSGTCVRTSPSNTPKAFHVQFFGTVLTRGWVTIRRIRFWQADQEDGGMQRFGSIKIRSRLQDSFSEAMAQAKEAAELSIEDRIQQWTASFDANKSSQADTAPQEPEHQTGDSNDSAKHDQPAPRPTKPKRRGPSLIQFVRKRTEELVATRPDLNLPHISALILEEWKDLESKRAQEEPLDDDEGIATATSSSPSSASPPSSSRRTDKSAKRPKPKRPKVGASSGPTDFYDNVCRICCEPGEMVCCEGGCMGSFHLKCIGLSATPPGAWVCDRCTTGTHDCAMCGKPGDLKKCNIKNCGRMYHLDCIAKLPLTKVDPTHGTFDCPIHVCANCHIPQSRKCSMVRCVKCPVAYHSSCVPAGCVVKVDTVTVCPRHFSAPTKVNGNCCLECGGGGALVCCDGCPAAYHQECLSKVHETDHVVVDDVTKEEWLCPDCKNGTKSMPDDIVWAKLGAHRFWPARVLSTDEYPLNMRDSKPREGTFIVRFFGSKDYCWLGHDRVIPWRDGDEKSRFAASGAKAAFKAAVAEAKEAADARNQVRAEIVADLRSRLDQVVPKFGRVRGNVYVAPRPPKDEIPICMCAEDEDGPACTDDSCLNRSVYVECDPKTCPAGERCCNSRLLKRQYPKLKPVPTPNKGWGLVLQEDIKQGDLVIEYVGEIIDTAECRRRLKEEEMAGQASFYLLSLGSNLYIDARRKANLARFINHSCDPNCITQKWSVMGEDRVGIFANKDIKAGTELTFDYQLDCLDSKVKTRCCCGAANCSGFIGSKPKKGGEGAGGFAGDSTDKTTQGKSKAKGKGKDSDKSKSKKKAKKKPKKPQVVHDDACFECHEGGELVMCDKAGCTKAYHVGCLGLEAPPKGSWYCPYHHCDGCGKASKIFCNSCSTSYCSVSCMKDESEDTKATVSSEAKPPLFIKCYLHVGNETTKRALQPSA